LVDARNGSTTVVLCTYINNEGVQLYGGIIDNRTLPQPTASAVEA
jgi:hypothetical protein